MPVARLHHQSITVMDLRTKIVESPPGEIASVKKHRSQGSDAELADSASRIQGAIDFDLGNGAGSDIELKLSDCALAVQQSVNRQDPLGRPRAHEPKVREVGKSSPLGAAVSTASPRADAP